MPKLVFAQIDNAVSERKTSETTLLVNPIRRANISGFTTYPLTAATVIPSPWLA